MFRMPPFNLISGPGPINGSELVRAARDFGEAEPRYAAMVALMVIRHLLEGGGYDPPLSDALEAVDRWHRRMLFIPASAFARDGGHSETCNERRSKEVGLSRAPSVNELMQTRDVAAVRSNRVVAVCRFVMTVSWCGFYGESKFAPVVFPKDFEFDGEYQADWELKDRDPGVTNAGMPVITPN